MIGNLATGRALGTEGGAAASSGPATSVQEVADRGIAGSGAALPHRATIQQLFGRHDVSHVAAHTDESARDASDAIGAEAYATGSHVAFATASPSLHTAAHEAAHVVQQRGGVQLAGGLGAAGDHHEQHADRVAGLVVQGRSAEHVLDEVAGMQPAGGAVPGAGAAVQRLVTVDGLDPRKTVIKQIAQYNEALLTVLAQPRIEKADVQRLKNQLTRIHGTLASPVFGLPRAQQDALKTRVATELKGLDAALVKPAELARLGSAAPAATEQAGHPSSQQGQAVASDLSSGDQAATVEAGPSSASAGLHVEPTSPEHAHALDEGPAHHAEEPTIADEEDQEAGPASLDVRTRQESETRIGFEIEPGGYYTARDTLRNAVAPFINQTLLTFTTRDGKALLEMLLDDPRVDKRTAIFQVEFRTPPLQLGDIHKDTATEIRQAIGRLAATKVFLSGQDLGTGWARSTRCDALIAAVGSGALTTRSRFQAPGELAQHVTSSINLGAYPRLPARQQQALYARGAGSKSKVELYQKILAALGTETIDASTRGRNSAGVTVKSSIESMLAAEQALGIDGAGDASSAMTSATRPAVASVGREASDRHAIPDLSQSVAGIRQRGDYPAMQGEGGSGYLAVAEKLQPPLYDPGNQQLRVLIEHRTDELRAAVNLVLSGKPSPVWDEFLRAASAMDRAR